MALVVSAMMAAACGGSTTSTPADTAKTPAAPAAEPQPAAPPADDPDAPLPPPAFESNLPEGVRAMLGKTFTGDLDEMVARRMIRVGVTFNRTFYFVDKGVQRGMAYEFGKAFEDELNKKLKTGPREGQRHLRAAAAHAPGLVSQGGQGRSRHGAGHDQA